MRTVVKNADGAQAASVMRQLPWHRGFSSLHFEAITIGIQKHLAALSVAQAPLKQKFVEALLALKKDPEFQRLTKGGGKNYAAALRQRVEFADERVGQCLV